MLRREFSLKVWAAQIVAGLLYRRTVDRLFFIFIFKKNKISQIYAEYGSFQKWVPVTPLMGDRVRVAHPVGDKT